MANKFDSIYPWSDIASVSIGSNAMVKIPKFYIRHFIPVTGEYAGKRCWEISKDKVDDTWHCHPAFMLNGQEIPFFYIGAYEMYNMGSNKGGSAAGQTPWVSLGGFENAKTYASAQGTDWHLQTIYERHAISLLFLLEYGHTNAQTAIGAGNSNSSAAVKTGASNAVYRGMHELWGNVWEHCDGIKGSGTTLQIWDNKGNHTYVNTGVVPVGGNYILDTFDTKGTDFDLGDVFIPKSVAAEASATFADYSWAPTSNFVVYVGGGWSSGTGCGVFSFDSDYGASSSGRYIGARVAKYPSAEEIAAAA